jgi:hypothetical protein
MQNGRIKGQCHRSIEEKEEEGLDALGRYYHPSRLVLSSRSMEEKEEEELVLILIFGTINVDLIIRVMAIPMGGHPVPYHPNIYATISIFESMGINNGKQPTLASIEKQLGPTYHAYAIYLRKFIIYLVAYVIFSSLKNTFESKVLSCTH